MEQTNTESDISRTTIYVLVLLTVLVSILGTWTVLSHASGTPAPVVRDQPVATGKVEFMITAPPQSIVDTATGTVGFVIQ